MAHMLTRFRGLSDEDAEQFMENLEFHCLLQGIEDSHAMLRMLRLLLQGNAKEWLIMYGKGAQMQQPALDVSFDVVKEAFLKHFKKVENVAVVWHELNTFSQKENQEVDGYVGQFYCIWDRWCIALGQEMPSVMLKENMFIAGLKDELRLKVELKRPQRFEDAVKVAKHQEWKCDKLREWGFQDVGVKPSMPLTWNADAMNVCTEMLCNDVECLGEMAMKPIVVETEKYTLKYDETVARGCDSLLDVCGGQVHKNDELYSDENVVCGDEDVFCGVDDVDCFGKSVAEEGCDTLYPLEPVNEGIVSDPNVLVECMDVDATDGGIMVLPTLIEEENTCFIDSEVGKQGDVIFCDKVDDGPIFNGVDASVGNVQGVGQLYVDVRVVDVYEEVFYVEEVSAVFEMVLDKYVNVAKEGGFIPYVLHLFGLRLSRWWMSVRHNSNVLLLQEKVVYVFDPGGLWSAMVVVVI